MASIVTTVTGIGAGLIIYGVLSFFFDFKIIIPLVAPAQFLSGALRLWVFRQYIHWRLAWPFFLGVLPGIYAHSSSRPVRGRAASVARRFPDCLCRL